MSFEVAVRQGDYAVGALASDTRRPVLTLFDIYRDHIGVLIGVLTGPAS